MRQLMCLVMLVGVAPVLVWGQARPKVEDRRPALMVEDGQNHVPLSLTKADIRVVVTGFLAETTMTFTFHNERSRVMEGELVFPLPEGATVSGYGLDVNGVIVDGVPVEKQKARITFEKEVRKGVDPGIVEHVTGNNYRTRVYPIPAKGDRTVKIQYVSDLVQQGGSVSYTLPMNWGGQAVGEYHLKVELVDVPSQPQLAGSAAKTLELKQAGNRTVTEKTYQNTKFADDLTITLPAMPSQHVIVEKYRPQSAAQAEHYFVINDLPKVPMIKRAAVQPRRIGILWDASLSRADADKSRELSLIAQIIEQAGKPDVDVVLFRNTVDQPAIFTAGKLDQLIAFLKAVKYDGATNLGQLSIHKSYHQFFPGQRVSERVPDYAYWLLFTDGLGNLGGDMPRSIETPVYAFSNDSRAKHALLSHIARTSGGQYFNVTRADNEQIVPQIGYAPFSLLSVECNPGEIADVYPRGVAPVQGRLAIAGRLRVPEAKITLNYGIGTSVMQRQTYTLKQAGATETGQAARFWAQQKIAELSVFPEKNHDELLHLGQRFSIVTPNTSLMVLERLEQYLEYKITPPRSRPDIYNAYVARIEQQRTEQKKSAEQKLVQVQAMWDAKVKWWGKEYSYPKDFVYKEPAPNDPAALGLAGGANRPRMAAAPRAAAPAPAQPLRSGELPPDRDVEQRTAVAPAVVASDSGVLLMGGQRGANAAAGEGSASGPSITIKPWDPDTPYLVRLKNTKPEEAYDVYLDQRKQFGSSPGFYLDCADYFLKLNQRDSAVRILSDVAELQLDSAPLLRVAAHRFAQIGELDLAAGLFEKALAMRPEEPQSYRDLALVLADRAERAMKESSLSERTRSDLVRSMDLLNKVVTSTWDERFPEIEVIALEELNRLIAMIRANDPTKNIPIPLDSRLVKLLDVDVRIVLTWDADATDIDLWVVEPSTEKCYYEHALTTVGGAISRDFTQGYGPEEYGLRKAMSGPYKIQANFYGSSQQSLMGPTTIQATVFTNYGRPDEKRQSITKRLVGQKEVIDIGAVEIGGR